ncbi:MAG: hypothetical protein L0G55_11040 [Corynebacterium sp.]|nr:hypothetical protein [Corynebacterium sp.]
MSDLTLGPVVGKIGGATVPLDFSPSTPSTSVPVDLPDGEWAIVVEAVQTGYGSGSVSIGDVSVTTPGRNMRGYAVRRHVTSPTTVTGSATEIRKITAFPDPTP